MAVLYHEFAEIQLSLARGGEVVVAAADEIRPVEAAAFSCPPSLRVTIDDGWLIRFGDGHTKRANSANPLYPMGGSEAGLIDRVESAYRRSGRAAIFRLTPLAALPRLDERLAARGYRLVEPSRALILPGLDDLPRPGVPAGYRLSLEPAVGAAWLAARHRLHPLAPAEQAAQQRLLGLIAVPSAFAVLSRRDVPVAVALGTVNGGWFSVNYVATAAEWRGQGLMQAVMGELGSWACREGAVAAQLFVLAGNVAAEALYHRLGYRERYRYHYRIREQLRPALMTDPTQ
jgi:GNAT superfamily N-acetyltransferase